MSNCFYSVRHLLWLSCFLPLSTVTAQPMATMSVVANNPLPCPGVGSAPVDANYTPSANGSFCLVPNYLPEINRYNFSDQGRAMPIADPTMVVFDNTYYATGTAHSYGDANLPLFAATDLTDWRITRTAFDERRRRSTPTGDRIAINGREFMDIWAPHLFYDPLVNRLYISFTAVECTPGVCELDWAPRTLRQSIYSASISVNAFRQGRYFADASDGGAAEPLMYGYRKNNEGVTRYFDGGFEQGQGYKLIPTSGNGSRITPTCVLARGCFFPGSARPGFVTRNGFNQASLEQLAISLGINLYPIEKRTWMHLDSFVFFDPQSGNQRWMFYTFEGSPIPNLNGHNIAAFPMINPVNMDAAANELTPFASAKNSHNGRNGLPNGLSGMPGAAGIAEGPAVFERNGWYYFLVSRNDTSTSDYMITYRRARSFRELSARSWDDQTIREDVLAVSSQRGIPGGISFGHGEVVRSASENRYYLILHRKDAQTQWWLHRVPFIKELTFNDATGEIESLQDNDPRGKRNDLNYFLIPRPTI